MGGGGGDWGYLELGPGTPAMGWGVHIQEKSSSGPRSKSHTAATIRKEVLTPPSQAPPPKRGTQVRGGTGVKIQKIIGGSLLVLK